MRRDETPRCHPCRERANRAATVGVGRKSQAHHVGHIIRRNIRRWGLHWWRDLAAFKCG